jgi:GTPase SAR1 family protein
MRRRRIILVVTGDAGSGKTSLVESACHGRCSDSPIAVLPPARLPADVIQCPDDVGDLLVIDTSSKKEDARRTDAALRAAAAVVVCVDAGRRGALGRLCSHWLPEVARVNPGAPVVVAVCKDDRESKIDLGDLREVRYQI